MKKLLCKLIFLFFISGCISNSSVNRDKSALYAEFIQQHKLESLERIQVFHFYGWRYLDSQHLIISTALSKPYLVLLNNSCHDLAFSQTIGINDSGSGLRTRFDSVFSVKFPQRKCFIKSIYKITRAQATDLESLGKNIE